jgi:hypothetical protein
MRGWREPSLDDILAEPIVRILMQRDGVREEEVRHIVAGLRTRRGSRSSRILQKLFG